MRAALFIVLSLAALAAAGPATFNRNNNNNKNEIDTKQQQHQQQQYGELKQTQTVELLKQWCFASQMSQPELTVSFKKLVSLVKSSPVDEATEAAVMSERICQGALVQKSAQSGETIANTGADAQAHELIKDVYMDAMIASESRECMQQLLKIIQSQKVDPIRASYYMTRMAVAEKDTIKDEQDVKQWAENLIRTSTEQQTSEAIERQKLLATTSILGKFMKNKCERNQKTGVQGELKQTAEQVVKTIIERYIRPVTQQEVQQYQQQSQQQQQQQPINKELVKRIAKRNAALKALANIPGCVLSEIQEVEQVCVELAMKKDELVTVRQSAIECLKHNEKVYRQLKELTFSEEEPIEVRISALRTLMTVIFAGKQEQQKQQIATELVEQLVKHCEQQRNQQQDDQFVLYVISFLDNLRTSQKPEHEAIRECISKNKQHYMQIQLLCKKFKQQLNDIRRSSRNYKLEQEFNQIESGLVLEGDIIYESKQKQQQQQQQQQINILPKLVRVNVSMPIMGETVNVVEITLRQNNMDEELLSTLKIVKDAKFNSESVSKVVDQFKSSVEKTYNKNNNNNNQLPAEADLTIKVDGCTVVYICSEDFKHVTERNTRNTRSVQGYSNLLEEVLEQLKRNPINFNRGFNVNINERLAKVLDVDANIIAGLRFNSQARGQGKDFEIVAQVEPRFSFQAIVGPAKMSSKKLLQRVSTKTAAGLRFRYVNNQLVDVQVDLPMNTMELFTFETQMVEKSQATPYSYTYLPESIYGQEDIYTPDEEFYTVSSLQRSRRSMKFNNKRSSLTKLFQGKDNKVVYEMETPEKVARMTGLRGKVRFMASPKDMSVFYQALVQKYEPEMEGYRFKLEKVSRGIEQQQILLTVSTPGSRVDRTMQVRAIVQQTKQHTLLKTEIQSPVLSTRMQLELVHDGRQYAFKAECVEAQANKWRHSLECGVQRNSLSQSGRIAATYKPYLSIQSTCLRRPIQMQGVVSYQQQPKTVISWEMKCPTSGDFVQGKLIVDQKQQLSYQNQNIKRSSMYLSGRRSMRSPLEMLLERDLTVSGEVVAQVREHLVKVHKMIDFDAAKFGINVDLAVSHKNLKRSVEESIRGNLKLNKDQQVVMIQRKCPQKSQKEFRLQIVSDCSQQQHQLMAECRYNSKRVLSTSSDLSSVVVYKHKIDVNELSRRQIQFQYNIELLANELKIDEKFQGRTEAVFERRVKSLRSEMSSRDKQCKLVVDFESLQKHQIELILESKEKQVLHKTLVRADERQFQCQSMTEKRGQLIAKLLVELAKYEKDCKVVFEIPSKEVRCVVDLKLNSAKPSSWAIQTPKLVSKAEFSVDFTKNYQPAISKIWRQPYSLLSAATTTTTTTTGRWPMESLKFKGDYKNLRNKNAYWIDTQLEGGKQKFGGKSYFRFNSPIKHLDYEFNPTDSSTKFGIFQRNAPSFDEPMYSRDESLLSQVFDFGSQLKQQAAINKGLNLGDKLWVFRTMLAPKSIDGLKKQMKQALFEYADRNSQQKHQINYSPIEQRLNFNFEHMPVEEVEKYARFGGNLSTKVLDRLMKKHCDGFDCEPSKLSMESELIDFDLDMKPFNGEESLIKLNALSRSPRSAGFKKHESELKYNKRHGYKGHVKHVDHEDRYHNIDYKFDQRPHKYGKVDFESDKHGKGNWEHSWRKYVTKRSPESERRIVSLAEDDDNEEQDVYDDNVEYHHDGKGRLQFNSRDTGYNLEMKVKQPFRPGHHNTIQAWSARHTRDVESQMLKRPYSVLDYVKHVEANLKSSISKDKKDLYKLDFDYKPQHEQELARLRLAMPEEMLHETSVQFQPTERLYKLQSKLMNQRNQQVHYDLKASTRPMIAGLASSEEEPVFFNEQHPMLEQRGYKTGFYATKRDQLLKPIFKQPLKLEYSDKFGRVARLDYDLAPEQGISETVGQQYYGLRPKRAAFYYKNEAEDIEHDSSIIFHPELITSRFSRDFMTKYNINTRRSGSDYHSNIHTKYGPIVLDIVFLKDNSDYTIQTPLFNFKFTNDVSSSLTDAMLFKFRLDNKQQRVQLAEIIRQTFLVQYKPIVRFAQKFDELNFQHQTELIVGDTLMLKSSTYNKERLVMTIDGELNARQDKLFVKIDGDRVNGNVICDLVNGSTEIVLDVDDNRTFQHQTRLIRSSDKCYTIESMATYEQKPLFKLNGEISSMIFSPEYLLSKHSRYTHQEHEHQSSNVLDDTESLSNHLDVTIYQPKLLEGRIEFDVLRKEAEILFKNNNEKRIQKATIKYDAPNMTIYCQAELSSAREGKIYSWHSKLAIPGFFYPHYCREQQSCQSELYYSATKHGGEYMAKYYPDKYLRVITPFGTQTIDVRAH